MGVNQSKKATVVPESDSPLARHIKESHNTTFVTKQEDSVTLLDRQIIETIKKDLSDNPELFVLNNMLMGIMFFENYSKCIEDLKKEMVIKNEDYLAPDLLFEKVSKNVVYSPHHGPKKKESEPLVPKRLFVFNNWVKVLGYGKEDDEINGKTVVKTEDSLIKGYVRLREIDTNYDHSRGYPILRLDSTEPNSRGSTDSSDMNYYTELEELKTPKPIEIIRGLEKHEQKSDLPLSCISYRKIKRISWDNAELYDEQLTEDDLYETVSYVNSKSFMKQVKNYMFMDHISSKLCINFEDILDTKTIQEKISCNVKQEDRTISYEIRPCLQFEWPLSQTSIFLRKRERAPEGRKRYIFPTSTMIDELTKLECVLLPKGYIKKKSKNKDADIEWEINFPYAQRYLESFMSHAQMKSLLILITLHKTYIEPKTTHFGLLIEHIRNFMFWECEANFSEWPEHRLGIKLIQVIKSLNTHLSKARPNIPDYFINDKNSLSDIATPRIRHAQKILDEILQAPLMYFIRALRNLKYTNEASFFPSFNFQKLYSILTNAGVVYSNPQLAKKMQGPKNEDPLIWLQHFEDKAKREKIWTKRIEDELKEKQGNVKEKEERRGSIDSISVKWSCEKRFDLHKTRALLKFFIDTFLDIAEKSFEIGTKSNTLLYIKQVEYLTKILADESSAFEDEAKEIFIKINRLRKQYDNIKATKTLKQVPPPKLKTDLDGINKPKEKNQTVKPGPRKSVAFVDVHKNSN